MKKIIAIIVSLVVATLSFTISGCVITPSEETHRIEDVEWVLKSYGPTSSLAPVPGAEITLTFNSSEDEVRGNAGCNSYVGPYTLSDNELSIGQLARTEMYCIEPPGVMEQEARYLDILQDAESFHVTEGKLQINCGEEMLIFVQQ